MSSESSATKKKSLETRLAKAEKDIQELRGVIEELVKNQSSAMGQVRAQYDRAAKRLSGGGGGRLRP